MISYYFGGLPCVASWSSVDKLFKVNRVFGYCWLMDSQFMHDPTIFGSRTPLSNCLFWPLPGWGLLHYQETTTHWPNIFLFGQVPPTKINISRWGGPHQLGFPPKSSWVGWLLPPWPSLDRGISDWNRGKKRKSAKSGPLHLEELVAGGHSFIQIFWIFNLFHLVSTLLESGKCRCTTSTNQFSTERPW